MFCQMFFTLHNKPTGLEPAPTGILSIYVNKKLTIVNNLITII